MSLSPPKSIDRLIAKTLYPTTFTFSPRDLIAFRRPHVQYRRSEASTRYSLIQENRRADKYLLRRAAASAVTQQPTWQLSTLRPAASRLTSLRPAAAASRPFHQSRIWFVQENEKTPAEKAEASPAEAETSGETVTTEPSAAEEQIKEESVPLDATSTPATQDAASGTFGSSPVDAVSESSGTTSASLGSSEAQPQQDESIIEKTQDLASSAAQSVSSATTGAAQAARDAFQNTATTNQRSTNSEFPPRQPATQQAPRAQNPGTSGGFRPRTDNPPSRILYVGNLFFEVTAPQLEAEFVRFGEVTNSRIATDPRGLSKGFGYIEFSTQNSADRAVQELDQKVFEGRRMAVQYHVRREGPRGGQGTSPMNNRGRVASAPSKTLFVGNMSYQMSDRDLNDLFREIRNVLDVRVAIDRRSGQPRGFAHADFIDIASAEKAKELLDTKVVYGRQLKIDFSSSNASTKRENDSGREES